MTGRQYRIRIPYWRVFTLMALVLSLPLPLSAQTPDESAYKLEAITVTAQKQKENIRDIPGSVTALSDTQIEDAGMLETEDLIYRIPNLHIVKLSSHGSGSALSMRGVSTIQGDLSMSPAVGFYVDDVYYSGGLDTQLLDLERIEVLRGPQGTLYGRNTEAGVINLITKKPGNELEGKASVSYGSDNTRNYRLSLGGPLAEDRLFFKISGAYYRSDGYVDNKTTGKDDAADMDDRSLRAALRWLPADAWAIDFSTEYLRFRDGRDNWSPSTDPYDTFTDYEGIEETDAIRHTLRAEYQGEHVTVTSVSSFRNWQDDQDYDLDFSSADIYRYVLEQDFDTLTQEIRLASPEDTGPLKWLGGVYFFREDKDFKLVYDMRQGYPSYGLGAFKQIQESDLDAEGYAVFGQATCAVFDHLDLIAGLRYEHEKKALRFSEYYDQDLSLHGMTTQSASPDDEDYDEFLPKLSIACSGIPDIMTYASVARGYKSGGFNIYSSAYAGTPYDPEYTWNYEAGAKTSWLDGALTVNLALFYIDWKDQIVYQFVDAANIIFRNAAKSTSKGFEMELLARPAKGFEITAGFGFTDMEFEDFTYPVFDSDTASSTYGQQTGAKDYSGNCNAYVPEYTYDVGIQYRHLRGFFGRLELQGVGDYYYDFANTHKAGGYALMNARIGYEAEHFSGYLWGRNILDKEYATSAVEDPTGMDPELLYLRNGSPFTIGVTLTVNL